MELEVIGICPVCHKGKMVKGSLGFSCNYFRSINDKCSFNIYHTYFGKVIDEDIAKELIETGETEVFHDLKRKDGTIFSAALKISNGQVVPSFFKTLLTNKCPLCGGEIEEMAGGYACVNYYEAKCKLFIPALVCEREISISEAETLLEAKKTGFLEGFKSKNGETFQSRLSLSEDGRISFDNILCKCPKCGGDVYAGSKAYNCSNQKNQEHPCNFVIWGEIFCRKISTDEAIQLCRDKQTPVLDGFWGKNGSFSRKLILNDDFKVKLV